MVSGEAAIPRFPWQVASQYTFSLAIITPQQNRFRLGTLSTGIIGLILNMRLCLQCPFFPKSDITAVAVTRQPL